MSAWAKYSPVRHWCAAYYERQSDYLNIEISKLSAQSRFETAAQNWFRYFLDELPYLSLSVFVGVANWYREFGASFRSAERSKPLLEASEDWQVPWLYRLFRFEFQSMSLSDNELELVKTYRASQS